ncbi:MAG: acetyl-CoA C-acyltransferase, partial [Steroidobacteraceae bacterium]|nr:acetyl-CoA C-acyltransferase [Steroidobacteraceae bacterium]
MSGRELDAWILDVVRTPRGAGRPNGALHGVRPIELVAGLLDALRRRCPGVAEAAQDFILGCVTQTGEQGGNLARIAALYAGYSAQISGLTVNRFCASGLSACALAAQALHAQGLSVVVAGGVESMSRVPMMSDGGPWYADPQVARRTRFVHMGIAADLIATLEGFERAALDAYAIRTHARAARARDEGRFARSMIPVTDAGGSVLAARDELVRHPLDTAKLSALEPAFAAIGASGADAIALEGRTDVSRIEHRHTVATSPAMADGAALVLLASRDGAQRLAQAPRARIVATAEAADDPVLMLTAGQLAAQRALAAAGLEPRDLDVVEFNESFAAVTLKFERDLDLDPERLNPNG